MSYKAQKDVLASITTRTHHIGDKDYIIFDAYVGTNPLTKKVVRFYDRDRIRLETKVKDFFKKLRQNGDLATALNAEQIIDASSAYRILVDAGVKTTLQELAQNLVDSLNAKLAQTRKTAREGFEEYLATFTPEQYLSVKSVKYRVGHLFDIANVGPDILLCDITPAHIVKYLSNFASSPKTYNGVLTNLATFFNWCANPIRGYVAKSPTEHIDKKQVAMKEPEFVKPDVAEKLFRLFEANRTEMPDVLAWAILSYFCGMRREEIIRLATDKTAGRVSLEDITIRIAKVKGYQKGIRPRAFTIPDTALAWMRSFDFVTSLAKVDERTTVRALRLVRANKLDLIKNGGRHSFITYHVAVYGEPSKTEGIVGTSATMRANHYMGLASKADGVRYFGILPS